MFRIERFGSRRSGNCRDMTNYEEKRLDLKDLQTPKAMTVDYAQWGILSVNLHSIQFFRLRIPDAETLALRMLFNDRGL